MTRASDGRDLRCARTNVRSWTGVSLNWVGGRARDGSDAYTVLRHGSVRSHVTLVHRARDPHASRQGGWADDDGLWSAHGIVGDALGSAVRAAPSQSGVSCLSGALRLGQQVALIAARRLGRSRDHGRPQSAFAARREPRRSMARTHGAASRRSASPRRRHAARAAGAAGSLRSKSANPWSPMATFSEARLGTSSFPTLSEDQAMVAIPTAQCPRRPGAPASPVHDASTGARSSREPRQPQTIARATVSGSPGCTSPSPAIDCPLTCSRAPRRTVGSEEKALSGE